MRKSSFLLVAGACVAALFLAVGTALAHPVPRSPHSGLCRGWARTPPKTS
jgi:hypothetical protein